MSFAVGAKVRDHTRSTEGKIWKRTGALLHLQDSNGYTWSALEHRCTLVENASGERVSFPPNTRPQSCTPDQMKVNDYVRLDDKCYRVEDMRSKGGATGRVLILDGYGPWVMTDTRQIFRPV
ncbi:hypothetical protein [Streptomyces sp. NPDC059991]|uniref:hypothetical protein n=1 Tax=unclassified Streptomyces TaxID=2593676 RepID=UPI0036950789